MPVLLNVPETTCLNPSYLSNQPGTHLFRPTVKKHHYQHCAAFCLYPAHAGFLRPPKSSFAPDLPLLCAAAAWSRPTSRPLAMPPPCVLARTEWTRLATSGVVAFPAACLDGALLMMSSGVGQMTLLKSANEVCRSRKACSFQNAEIWAKKRNSATYAVTPTGTTIGLLPCP